MGVAWTGRGEPRLPVLTCSHLSSLDVRDGRRCDCDELPVETPAAEPWLGLLICLITVLLIMAAVLRWWPT